MIKKYNNKESNIYYLYVHFRKTDNKPFYIGKGKNDRAYQKNQRNKWWNNVVAKHGYYVRIIIENLSEEDAYLLEEIVGIKMMALYKETMTNNPLAFGLGGNRIDWNTRNDLKEQRILLMKTRNPSMSFTSEKKREVYQKIQETISRNKGLEYKPFVPYEKKCKVCGDKFPIPSRSLDNKLTCSDTCRNNDNKNRMKNNNPF